MDMGLEITILRKFWINREHLIIWINLKKYKSWKIDSSNKVEQIKI